MSIEEKFRRYHNEFNGTNNTVFSLQLFDDLYHDDFVNDMDGVPVKKAQLMKIQKGLLGMGTKASVEYFVPVGTNLYEFKLTMSGQRGDMIINNLICTKDDKIVEAFSIGEAPLDAVLKARKITQVIERCQAPQTAHQA